MSEYLPPQTQNPIFDPVAWIPRSVAVSGESAVIADVSQLTNEADIAYNDAKTINLALSKYSVTNTNYLTQTGLLCNAPQVVYSLPLAAGSYVISGNFLINTSLISTTWTAIYLYALVQGVAQQGWAVANNVPSTAFTSLNYVPFTFYCASPSNSQTDITFKIIAQVNGPTTAGLTYNIGPASGSDVSLCKIIGSNPYLAY
jgi:hypothetical protein